MRAIRHRMYGVLEQTGIIAHRQKMACWHGWPRGAVRRDQVWLAACDYLQPVAMPRILEGGEVALRGTLPRHRSAGRGGSFAHCLPARVVGEQLRNFVADPRRVAKGNQNAAPIEQQIS